MNLKNAFRYSNFLTEQISQLQNLTYASKNYTTTKVTSFKSKAIKDEEDTIEILEVDRDFDCKMNDIYFIILDLISEKTKLEAEIALAKSGNKIDWKINGQEVDLDTAVSYNRAIRKTVECFSKFEKLTSTTEKTKGSDYTFNINNEQVMYRYDVERVVEIDYDKDVIKAKNRKLKSEADSISDAIDAFMLKDIVSFEAKYDINSSMQDIVTDHTEAK